MFGYFIGAVAALLQLILAIREIETGIGATNPLAPFQGENTNVGYQHLSGPSTNQSYSHQPYSNYQGGQETYQNVPEGQQYPPIVSQNDYQQQREQSVTAYESQLMRWSTQESTNFLLVCFAKYVQPIFINQPMCW